MHFLVESIKNGFEKEDARKVFSLFSKVVNSCSKTIVSLGAEDTEAMRSLCAEQLYILTKDLSFDTFKNEYKSSIKSAASSVLTLLPVHSGAIKNWIQESSGLYPKDSFFQMRHVKGLSQIVCGDKGAEYFSDYVYSLCEDLVLTICDQDRADPIVSLSVHMAARQVFEQALLMYASPEYLDTEPFSVSKDAEPLSLIAKDHHLGWIGAVDQLLSILEEDANEKIRKIATDNPSILLDASRLRLKRYLKNKIGVAITNGWRRSVNQYVEHWSSMSVKDIEEKITSNGIRMPASQVSENFNKSFKNQHISHFDVDIESTRYMVKRMFGVSLSAA